ncbi:AAA family ATPase [Ponticaulis sp.]|uniref:AAA family ATPase n=1 Tax=Ponticaulis sp. TaxID=2020902 RepID=UPI000B672DEA|nr:AAA family ATPase [Ponticaulis sp.]MAJ09968.1 ATP-binding protein [Ponticaulis sp.]|tara:strand:- start:23625 stop:24776 length:1152 start_codon:yes stop_codon:yes gene_type:complete
MLISFAVEDYRSLRKIKLPLERLNVVTGSNGSGKSSLYRSLQLLASVGQGRVISALANEGGLSSTIWAGPESIAQSVKRGEHELEGTVRNQRISLKLGFASEDFGYAIDLGVPIGGETVFLSDPDIKTEVVWAGPVLRRANVLAQRNGPLVTALGSDGDRVSIKTDLAPYDSMLTYAADASTTPELIELRERMRGWRFYDQLRTDKYAPCRTPHVGTRTFALAEDGSDLAAAIATIREIGDGGAFEHAIEDAFPGSEVEILQQGGLFDIVLKQTGMLRPLRTAELSDGTLRFLLLAAALLTPRPPQLMVLNEPETSLHSELIPALGRLILRASENCQMIVVSHNSHLVEILAGEGAQLLELSKDWGETHVEGADPISFSWPSR